MYLEEYFINYSERSEDDVHNCFFLNRINSVNETQKFISVANKKQNTIFLIFQFIQRKNCFIWCVCLCIYFKLIGVWVQVYLISVYKMYLCWWENASQQPHEISLLLLFNFIFSYFCVIHSFDSFFYSINCVVVAVVNVKFIIVSCF